MKFVIFSSLHLANNLSQKQSSTFRKIAPIKLEVEPEIQVESEPYIKNQLILRTVGCGQLLPNGQRLCLESSERVVAAIRPRIHCEYHALAAVAGRSVCSLATVNPNGFRLERNDEKRQLVPSCAEKSIFGGNAYVFNNKGPAGELVVSSNTRHEKYLDG